MRPETEADLAQIIRRAETPLSFIGGGTRLLPGEGQGAPVDMGALSGITIYEPEALTLVAGAGTPLQTIRDALAAEGQMLGFEPDARPGSTIGGVVAANASGPRRVLAGACRDALIGVRFVDGQGEIVKNGGRVMKNVTGYDLVKLMAGSRGALGAITQVSFRTTPIAPTGAILRLPDLDAPAAIAALTAALTGPYDVTAAGWTPASGALIRIEGLPKSVAIRRAALLDRLSRSGDVSDGAADQLHDLSPVAPQAGARLWRIICRPSEAAVLLAALPQPRAVDWGGGLIWVDLPGETQPDLPRFSGHATCMSGPQPLTIPPPNPVVARLNDGLRQRFDPRGIFAGTG